MFSHEPLPGIENKPIRDIAYETLKHAIIMGEIQAGTRIIETYYAEKMHISRTPLREALRLLELDGLVEYKERKGVIVTAFTIEDIEEIFTIRNAMMMLILPSIVSNVKAEDTQKMRRLLSRMDACLNNEDCSQLAVLNREFHGTMDHISDKIRILRVIDSQEEYIKRFSALAISSIVRRTDAQQEHYRMVEYLENKDLDGLRALTQRHLEESKQTCLHAVSKGRNRT